MSVLIRSDLDAVPKDWKALAGNKIVMSDPNEDDLMTRVELLLQLRQAIRRSRQLAEALLDDPLIGREVQGLVARLDAIQFEMDKLRNMLPRSRPAYNDATWPRPSIARH